MGSNDDERVEAYINQYKNDKMMQKKADSEKSGKLIEFLKEIFVAVAPVIIKAIADFFR